MVYSEANMLNIRQLRADTPGCEKVTHFNNAGCSLHTTQVLNAVEEYLHLEQTVGGYEAAVLREKEIQSFYTSVATLINCKPSNIAFAHSATDAYSKALLSVPFQEGDVILTTENDYVSNQIQFLSLQKRNGVKIIRAKNSSAGEVDCTSIEENIKKHHPKIVAVTHVPTNSGLIQPVEEIGALCKNHDVLFLVDACQSAGQLELDVEKIHCDFLSATMRKFVRGPRGTGFLYVSNKILDRQYEPLLIDMRGADWVEENEYRQMPDAKRFEYIELSYALLLGAAAAVNYAMQVGLKTIEKKNEELCTLVRQRLSDLPKIQFLDKGSKQASIITLVVQGKSVFKLKDVLSERKINTGAAPKKVALIDFTQKNTEAALRISPHYYNTAEEVEILITAIADFIQ